MGNSLFYLPTLQGLYLKSYNKRIFKACDARKNAAYYGVCEDFEGERNAENTLLDGFI